MYVIFVSAGVADFWAAVFFGMSFVIPSLMFGLHEWVWDFKVQLYCIKESQYDTVLAQRQKHPLLLVWIGKAIAGLIITLLIYYAIINFNGTPLYVKLGVFGAILYTFGVPVLMLFDYGLRGYCKDYFYSELLYLILNETWFTFTAILYLVGFHSQPNVPSR